jgi:hypothetical protein
LTAFLAAIDELVRMGMDADGILPDAAVVSKLTKDGIVIR